MLTFADHLPARPPHPYVQPGNLLPPHAQHDPPSSGRRGPVRDRREAHRTLPREVACGGFSIFGREFPLKRNVFLGALAWALLISVAHLQLNIGWGRFVNEVKIKFGAVRREMIVGFLPVT